MSVLGTNSSNICEYLLIDFEDKTNEKIDVITDTGICANAINSTEYTTTADCYDAYQCAFSTLPSSSTSFCFGFRSCYQAEIGATDNAHFACHGSFSCYKAKSLKFVDTSKEDAYCMYST